MLQRGEQALAAIARGDHDADGGSTRHAPRATRSVRSTASAVSDY
jgi:hypothetical protein